MILKTTFNYFLKFFMEAVFTGKEITKNYFFLMIDADDFQILPEIILYRRLKHPVRQPQEEAVSVVSYELVIQIILAIKSSVIAEVF